jgi:hypothetical protein
MDFKQYPEEYSRVFSLGKSIRQYEEESVVAGFGSAPQKGERESTVYDDPIQGNRKRYTFLTYSLGFRVSRELWEDDLYGIMKQMPEELAFSMRDVVEVTAAGTFINGFTDSSAYIGPDGEPLFGDGTTKTHPLMGGGTWANQLSVAADLNVDSLELMLNLIGDQVNDRGLLTRAIPELLIVPTELQWVAKQLLESDLEAFTAQNQSNPFSGMDMKYFVWHYLTDPDAWFIRCKRNYLKFWWRLRPDFHNSDDFDNDDAKFKSRERFDQGYTDARGIYGSPGA